MKQLHIDRIEQLMQSNQLTHNAFARKCSIDPSNFRKMMAGTLPITPTSLRKIAEACGVRYEWLLRGEGEMVAQRQLDGVPMLDGEQVRAGALAGAGQPLLPADIIKLPELRWHDGDFAVRANGRSMLDPLLPDRSIPDGAIIILRPWTESHIQWGETYCIATTDGYAIKRLMPGDDAEHIKCVSNNEAEGYAPYQVARSDLRGIAIVTAIIHLTTLHQ